MKENQMEVISPIGGEIVEKKTMAPRLDTLNGKTVCEVWNGGFKGDYTFTAIRELLKERYSDVKVIPHTEFPTAPWRGTITSQREVAKQIAKLVKEKGCDALISGNGA